MPEYCIECAETGRAFTIRLDNCDAGSLRTQIFLLSEVAPNEQIILVGPPFKKLDMEQLRRKNYRRMYLYNKKVFASDDSRSQPPPTRLQPHAVFEPLPIGDLSNSTMAFLASSSPLLKALPDYEKAFLMNFRRGESYITTSEQALLSCKHCAEEHQIQRNALVAAVSNLKDHFLAAKVAYEELQGKLRGQHARHQYLIDGFEANLLRLRAVPLHPTLVAMAQTGRGTVGVSDSGSAAGSGASSLTTSISSFTGIGGLSARSQIATAGRGVLRKQQHDTQADRSSLAIETDTEACGFSSLARSYAGELTHRLASPESGLSLTLLDCIPVDKERAWAQQSAEVHRKVAESLVELEAVFNDVTAKVQALEDDLCQPATAEAEKDAMDESDLSSVVQLIKEKIELQRDALVRFSHDLDYVRLIVPEIAGRSVNISPLVDNSPEDRVGGGGDMANALTELEQRRRQQEDVSLPSLESECAAVMRAKQSMERSKEAMTKRVYRVLRCIAALQTDIQYRLKDGMKLMVKWQRGHNQYFSHLESVVKLPDAYESFLLEVVRRRAFNRIFESRLMAVSNELAALRDTETGRREQFMQSAGSSLPPLFFQCVPSLKEKPPYFSQSLTSAQWLPDVTIADVLSVRKELSLPPLSVQEFEQGKTQRRHMVMVHGDLDQVYSDPGAVVAGSIVHPDSTDEQVEKGLGRTIILPAAAMETEENRNGVVVRDDAVALAEAQMENAWLMARILELTSSKVAKTGDGVSTCSDPIIAGDVDIQSTTSGLPSAGVSSAIEDANIPDTDCGSDEHPNEAQEAQAYVKRLEFELHDALQRQRELQQSVEAEKSQNIRMRGIFIAGLKVISTAISGDSFLAAELADTDDLVASAPNRHLVSNIDLIDDIEGLAQEIDEVAALVEVTKDRLVEKIKALRVSLSFAASRALAADEKISFRDLGLGSIALFIATNSEKKVFFAFSRRQPNFYLSPESLRHFMHTKDFGKGFVLGRIIYVERRVASLEENLGGLALGTEYFLVECEQVREGFGGLTISQGLGSGAAEERSEVAGAGERDS